jgi:hypothetical protein
MRWNLVTRQIIPLLIAGFVMTSSVMRLEKPLDKARLFTAGIEYDYVAWTFSAVKEKAGQAQVNATQRLTPHQQSQVVIRYFDLVRELEITRAQIHILYSDPDVTDAEAAAAALIAEQHALEDTLNDLAALTEAILQHQVSQVLADAGLGFLAQQVPPVLFHSTPLPTALIVSPRDTIRQDVNLSLMADLSLEEISQLEAEVEAYMNVSALVEDVGGIGVYPTMVQRASSLEWTLNTITHEWTHNYLSLHPLGLRYNKTPELRTMNETTASIVGNEISNAVLARFYPEYIAGGTKVIVGAAKAVDPARFDFYHEMHVTRVRVDELLAEGKIEEAEAYMEARRIEFVKNGYMIRKLNQAYFAFHGAYAEGVEGAAGQDPVGPAVRALRAQSDTVIDFLRRIARMNSFDDLQQSIRQD